MSDTSDAAGERQHDIAVAGGTGASEEGARVGVAAEERFWWARYIVLVAAFLLGLMCLLIESQDTQEERYNAWKASPVGTVIGKTYEPEESTSVLLVGWGHGERYGLVVESPEGVRDPLGIRPTMTVWVPKEVWDLHDVGDAYEP